MKLTDTMLGIFAVLTVASCGTEKPAEENGFLFFDASLQRAFVAALEKEGIKYHQQGDGTALYSSKDEDKVQKVRMKVLESSFTPSYHFEEQEVQTRFKEKLRSAGIRSGVEIRQGQEWVTWSEQDDARVKEIREKLLDEMVHSRQNYSTKDQIEKNK